MSRFFRFFRFFCVSFNRFLISFDVFIFLRNFVSFLALQNLVAKIEKETSDQIRKIVLLNCSFLQKIYKRVKFNFIKISLFSNEKKARNIDRLKNFCNRACEIVVTHFFFKIRKTKLNTNQIDVDKSMSKIIFLIRFLFLRS